jgi:hypothetical protein
MLSFRFLWVTALVLAILPLVIRGQFKFAPWQGTVRVLSVPIPSLLNVTNIPGQYVGFVPDLLNQLATCANFNYSWQPLGTTFGALQSDNKTFDGIVGQLLNNQADLLATPLDNSTDYQNAMLMTIPLYLSEVVVLQNSQVPPPNPGAPPGSQGPPPNNGPQTTIPYYCILESTATHTFIAGSPNPTFQGMITSFNAMNSPPSGSPPPFPPPPNNYTGCVQCVVDGHCVFPARTPAVNNALTAWRNLTLNMTSGSIQVLRTVAPGFAVQPSNYQLAVRLDDCLLQLHGSNVIKKLFQQHFPTAQFSLPVNYENQLASIYGRTTDSVLG